MIIQPQKEIGVPLYFQISEHIKQMILSQELQGGIKLPSERRMSALIGVHRNTIKHAYDELVADGYIIASERRGYFVSNINDAKPEKGSSYGLRWSDIIKSQYINRRIEEQFSSFFKKECTYSFSGDIMHSAEIGGADLKNAIRKFSNNINENSFTITHRQGDYSLRKELVNFLQKSGINAKAGEIQIISETFQAIDYIACMTLNAGDEVILPETVCPEIIRIFSASCAKIHSVNMDSDGIDCDEVEKILNNGKVKLIYVEPDFSIPTGFVMSLDRRKKLLQLSYKFNVPIIEEGGNADLRHEGERIPSLKSLDKHDSVVYVYSFYYKIPSGLRIAFVTGSKRLISDLSAIIQSRIMCQDVVSQYTLREYLRDGYYLKNLEQINKTCNYNKKLMYKMLEPSIARGLDITFPQGGVFLWAKLPSKCNNKLLQIKLSQYGISCVPGKVFFTNYNRDTNYIRFCYYCSTDEEITKGIKLFNEAFIESLST